jgi:hypothetical protein
MVPGFQPWRLGSLILGRAMIYNAEYRLGSIENIIENFPSHETESL